MKGVSGTVIALRIWWLKCPSTNRDIAPPKIARRFNGWFSFLRRAVPREGVKMISLHTGKQGFSSAVLPAQTRTGRTSALKRRFWDIP
jgi:hypothetical protein